MGILPVSSFKMHAGPHTLGSVLQGSLPVAKNDVGRLVKLGGELLGAAAASLPARGGPAGRLGAAAETYRPERP